MRTLSGTLIDYELIDILDTKPIPDHGTLIRSKLVTIDLIIINRFNHACRARYCFTNTVRPSVTLMYCIKTVQLFPQSDGSIALVFEPQQISKFP